MGTIGPILTMVKGDVEIRMNTCKVGDKDAKKVGEILKRSVKKGDLRVSYGSNGPKIVKSYSDYIDPETNDFVIQLIR